MDLAQIIKAEFVIFTTVTSTVIVLALKLFSFYRSKTKGDLEKQIQLVRIMNATNSNTYNINQIRKDVEIIKRHTQYEVNSQMNLLQLEVNNLKASDISQGDAINVHSMDLAIIKEKYSALGNQITMLEKEIKEK